jgi:hypothetical protein
MPRERGFPNAKLDNVFGQVEDGENVAGWIERKGRPAWKEFYEAGQGPWLLNGFAGV